MNCNRIILLALFVSCTTFGRLKAADPCCRWLGCAAPDCVGQWCCDDYDSKCMPCVELSFCFGCDDYCCKRLPCSCVPLCFQCDDYCKKCLPRACAPPLRNNLKCGPPPPCKCQRCCPATPLGRSTCRCFAQRGVTETRVDEAVASEPDTSGIHSTRIESPDRKERNDRFVVVREVTFEADFESQSRETSVVRNEASNVQTAEEQARQAASLRLFLRNLRR